MIWTSMSNDYFIPCSIHVISMGTVNTLKKYLYFDIQVPE